MVDVTLLPHSTTPCSSVNSIGVEVTRTSGSSIRLCYHLNAELAQLRLPQQVAQTQREELWRHTCFEAFVKIPNAQEYFEFNFSPSTEWAIYRFDHYRSGMSAVAASPTKIDVTRRDDSLALDVEFDLATWGMAANQDVQMGLSAVIESRAGSISYWAIKHPMPKPDFHHRDSFAMLLPSS